MTRKLSRKAVVLGVAAFVALLVVGTAVANASMGGGNGLIAKFRGHHGHGGEGAWTEADGLVSNARASFRVDVAAGTVTEYDVRKDNATFRLLDAIEVAQWSADVADVRGRGPAYVVGACGVEDPDARGPGCDDDGAILVLSGHGFAARSAVANIVTLTLPAGASVVLHDAVEDWSPAGATVTYSDGTTATLVVGKTSTVAEDGGDLVVTLAAGEHLAYHLGPLGHGLGGAFGKIGPHHGPEGMRGDHSGGGPRGRGHEGR